MRGATVMIAAIVASAASAAPPLSGKIDPNKVPSGPIGLPDVPLQLDIQASFDFTAVPTGDYKPAVSSGSAAQQLLVPKPSYVMIVPILGAPQRHALHIYGITNLTPDPISFLSRAFDVSQRKTLTVAWDGQFSPGDDTVELVVGVEGFADLARLAFRKGQISLVTPQGYKPFATYAGATIVGTSVTPSEHRFVMTCGALSHACTATFSQQGHISVSPTFTWATPSSMPTPPGPRRVSLRMTWPATEASSVHGYDMRRVTISGDVPGGG